VMRSLGQADRADAALDEALDIAKRTGLRLVQAQVALVRNERDVK
jgi:hypothetical protein